jgi:hypothetical protein
VEVQLFIQLQGKDSNIQNADIFHLLHASDIRASDAQEALSPKIRSWAAAAPHSG